MNIDYSVEAVVINRYMSICIYVKPIQSKRVMSNNAPYIPFQIIRIRLYNHLVLGIRTVHVYIFITVCRRFLACKQLGDCMCMLHKHWTLLFHVLGTVYNILPRESPCWTSAQTLKGKWTHGHKGCFSLQFYCSFIAAPLPR